MGDVHRPRLVLGGWSVGLPRNAKKGTVEASRLHFVTSGFCVGRGRCPFRADGLESAVNQV